MGKKLSRIIGIVIIAVIISRLDFAELKNMFSRAETSYLIWGLALTLLSAFAKAWRWNYLKKSQGIKYGLMDSFIIYCASHLAGALTPGRVGELAKIFYLKKDGYSYGQSMFSVVWDRIFDMIFLTVFSALGMFFFFNYFRPEIPYVLALIAAAVIIFLLAAKTKIIKKIIALFFNLLIPAKSRDYWRLNWQEFMSDLKKLKFKHYLVITLITIMSWLVYYYQMAILAKSVGLHLPFLFLAVSVTIAGLVTMIPISYLGIGTRDIILIGLFSFFNISQETTIVFSGLILSTYVVMAILGFACWLKKPLKF